MARSRQLIVVLAVVLLGIGASCSAVKRFVYVTLEPDKLEARAPVAGVGSHSAQACGACHTEIAAEWASSRMGQAFTEPLFAHDYAEEGEPYWCLRCHAPLEEQQPILDEGLRTIRPLSAKGEPNPHFDAELQAEGVTCVVCHLHDGVMVAGIDDPQGAPHPAASGDEAGEACERCHQLAKPPLSNLDGPLIDTYNQWRAWQEATGRDEDCVSCHMPTVERAVALGGPTRMGFSHTFPGAWDDALLADALRVQGMSRTDGAVIVEVENRTGHNLPTAEPARALVLRLLDADGGVVDEVALLRRVPLPKLIDEGDDRLRPAEVRAIALADPGEMGAQVRIVLDRVYAHRELAQAAGVPQEAWEGLIWEGAAPVVD